MNPDDYPGIAEALNCADERELKRRGARHAQPIEPT
jgi:hypothetical protein